MSSPLQHPESPSSKAASETTPEAARLSHPLENDFHPPSRSLSNSSLSPFRTLPSTDDFGGSEGGEEVERALEIDLKAPFASERRWRRGCCWLCACSMSILLILLVVGVVLVALSYSKLSKDDLNFTDDNSWPVVDFDGYYLSYKEGGRWQNKWRRGLPGLFTLGLAWKLKSDVSGFSECLSSSVCTVGDDIDDNLPVRRPYWLTTPVRDVSGGKTDESTNATLTEPPTFGAPGVRATWIGHATVLAEVDGSIILCDPIFSERCSPVQWFGPKRFRPPACTINQLPDHLDAVVISHSHYDHLDAASVRALHRRYRTSLLWYVPNGLRSWFKSFGVPDSNIYEMVWWEESVQNQTKIIFTPSNHWSSRTHWDTNKVLWGSWTIVGKRGNKFWFAGDTAYSDVFKQIGRKYGPFQLAAIPIGAYNPREIMKYSHVSPREAVMIHQDIGSLLSFGIHWGTFALTYEPYMQPKRLLQRIVKKKGTDENDEPVLKFKTLDIGETIEATDVIEGSVDDDTTVSRDTMINATAFSSLGNQDRHGG